MRRSPFLRLMLCALAVGEVVTRAHPASADSIVSYGLLSAFNPGAIAAGPDGNLWFTEGFILPEGVAKLTTAGVRTSYGNPDSGTFPSAITAGPDGNVWFTEITSTVHNVAKITPAGVFTKYVIPTVGARPRGIAQGPDGNLWFTEFSANKIGKVTTAGAFTEYAIPTPDSGPTAICLGPDGNLWFIETNVGRIGKVTTGGVFTEYAIPTPSNLLSDITAGPDGNLWFTQSSAPNVPSPDSVIYKIGKMTTGGVFSEYAIPTPGSRPSGITAGPDGNLWFTEKGTNKIGRVTTTGTFTEYAVRTTDPLDITAGPDGKLWFTEESLGDDGSGKVAKLDPLAPPLTCSDGPVVGCRTPVVGEKAFLLIKDHPADGKDKLIWKWIKGSATAKVPDFGTPLTTTDYQLCVYDGTLARIADAFAPRGGNCDGQPCWSDKAKGFKYKDKDFTPHGLEFAFLKEGEDGSAQIIFKGRGGDLLMPSLPITLPVTVQLKNSDGVCWEAVYSAPALDNSAGSPGFYRDKAD